MHESFGIFTTMSVYPFWPFSTLSYLALKNTGRELTIRIDSLFTWWEGWVVFFGSSRWPEIGTIAACQVNGAVHWDKTQPPAAQILYWLLYSNPSAFLAWFYHSKKKITEGHVNINTNSSLTLYHKGKFVSPWSKFSLDPCDLVKE